MSAEIKKHTKLLFPHKYSKTVLKPEVKVGKLDKSPPASLNR
jgi:hypothetical protein